MKNLWLLLPLLLAACSPQMRTNYQLNAPETESGRLCSSNCILMSNTCVNNCRAMSRQCARFDTYGYGGFGTGGWGHRRGGYGGVGIGYPLSSGPDCSSSQCEASCLAAARQCHTNCGGTITQQTVCVANCPKEPVLPVPIPQQ